MRGTGDAYQGCSSSRDGAIKPLPCPHPLCPPLQPPGRERLQNELQVRVRGCRGLRSRCLGALPSPYAMYRFFTFPDRDTPIVPASHSPHFGDLQTFPMHPTPELHRYLRHENLWVYVFDDEDPQPDAYLGKAAIPLLPLARGHSITGACWPQ